MPDFKWIGPKVDCYNPALKNGWFDYYHSFSYNGELFNIGEFALIKQVNSSKCSRIGRLLCVYHSHEKWNVDAKYRGTVRWYTWVKDLDPKMKPQHIKFDEKSEVIEDMRGVDVFISLEDIQKKCKLIFVSEDDSTNLIKNNRLNPDVYFFCRFRIQYNQVVPIFSKNSLNEVDYADYIAGSKLTLSVKEAKQELNYTDLIGKMSSNIKQMSLKNNEKFNATTELSPVIKRTSVKTSPTKFTKHKRSCYTETPVQDLDSEGSDVEGQGVDKIRSPANPVKSLRLTPQRSKANGSISSSLKRNSVKRVLNHSFENDFTSSSASSVFTYSVVSSDYRDNNNIRIKLKVQNTRGSTPLKVFPTKLDDNVALATSPIKLDDLQEVQNRIEFSPKFSAKIKDLNDAGGMYPVQVDLQIPAKAVLSARQQEKTPNNTCATNLPRRRSSRTVERKSYAEFISPDQNTPKKRMRRASVNNNHSINLKTPLKDKIDEYGDVADEQSKNTVRHAVQDVNKGANRSARTFNKGALSALATKESKNKFHEVVSSPATIKAPDKQLNLLSNISCRPKRNIVLPKKYLNQDCDSNKNSLTTVSPTKCHESQAKKNGGCDYSSRSNNRGGKDSAGSAAVEAAQRLNTTPRRKMRSCIENSPKSVTRPNHTTGRPKKYSSNADSDENDLHSKTPKQGSTVCTPKSVLKNTPGARARMIREGIITPSVQVRKKTVCKDSTPLSKARSQLHVSYIPKALPCREKEFSDIITFLEGKLLDGCGGCMYVSGVPGTGKTATVTEVIRSLQKSAENKEVPSFAYINVNGMRLSEPRQSYVEIVKQLLGKTVPWEQAQTMLENKFIKPQKKSAPIILVVDELDILCTKRQDVVYNLLDWPTKSNTQLIVITIANTMDLPERLLMGRVTSRLGLTRLTFQAYTHKQLQTIVTERLTGMNAFNPDAIQLVARKVASVSGDARRALDICRRAAELAELEGRDALVSMTHVNQALNAMITQPKVQAIKRCSRLEKLMLQAVVAEVERTGVEETTFASVLTMLVSIAALDGFPMVSGTIAMAALTRLGACRLLLTDQKCNNIYQRIILNVSVDDVYYAVTKTDLSS